MLCLKIVNDCNKKFFILPKVKVAFSNTRSGIQILKWQPLIPE